VRLGVSPGGTVYLGGRPFTVVGTVSDRTLLGGTPMVYTTLSDAQAIAVGGRALITAVVTRGSPTQVPAGLVAYTPDQVAATTLDQMHSAVSSIDNSKWMMWVVAAFIVAALLYVAALERQRDFAVLKALGSSSGALFFSMIVEAVVVTVIASVLAELLSSFMKPLFAQPIVIPFSAYATLPLIAVAVGVLASLVALRRATGADPAAAFG